MEENENSSRVSRNGSGTHAISAPHVSRKPTRRRRTSRRYDDDDDDDDDNVGGEDQDPVECSGKNCRSCTAGIVADCIAICCCPCAVVSFLGLALVKVPWAVGRKCLKQIKKKKKKKKNKKKMMKIENETDRAAIETDGKSFNLMRKNIEEDQELSEIENFSARFEAERIWVQLYQVGQLGFGRVSFTGNSNLWLNSN